MLGKNRRAGFSFCSSHIFLEKEGSLSNTIHNMKSTKNDEKPKKEWLVECIIF